MPCACPTCQCVLLNLKKPAVVETTPAEETPVSDFAIPLITADAEIETRSTEEKK